MYTDNNTLLAQRDAEICQLYDNDLSITINDLKTRYGLDRQQLKVILKKGDKKLRPEKRGRRKMQDIVLLSDTHKRVGHLIDAYMIRNDLGIREMSRRVNISPSELTYGREGKHDFTLSTLQKLAEVMGFDLSEVMSRDVTASNLYQQKKKEA
ncbi:MAG: hypothetical protein GC184_06215 [Rhizobiales bacterium]|nr:hypothetical protein [Hyphomicrobiales bacterium]